MQTLQETSIPLHGSIPKARLLSICPHSTSLNSSSQGAPWLQKSPHKNSSPSGVTPPSKSAPLLSPISTSSAGSLVMILRVQRITKAARELVERRDAWLNPPDCPESELKKRTLTNLYNQRPTWLDLAHNKLDEAVFDAYGWPHELRDEENLERLLELCIDRVNPPPN